LVTAATLIVWQNFEDDQGQSMEDIIDTKFGTNLSLTWTSTDTKTATELAKGIRGKYRY